MRSQRPVHSIARSRPPAGRAAVLALLAVLPAGLLLRELPVVPAETMAGVEILQHAGWLSLTGTGAAIPTAAIAPDGRSVAIAHGAVVEIRGIPGFGTPGSEVRTLASSGTSPIALAWSQDGRSLAGISASGLLAIWDTASGSVRLTLTDHQSDIAVGGAPGDGRPCLVSWAPSTFLTSSVTAGGRAIVRGWELMAGTGKSSWVSPIPTATAVEPALAGPLFLTGDRLVIVRSNTDGALVPIAGPGVALLPGPLAVSGSSGFVASADALYEIRTDGSAAPRRVASIGIGARGLAIPGAGAIVVAGGGPVIEVRDLPSGSLRQRIASPAGGTVQQLAGGPPGFLLTFDGGAGIDLWRFSLVSTRTRPSVAVITPREGALLTDIIDARGTAAPTGPGGVRRVELDLDESGWATAAGTDTWSLPIDPFLLGGGSHVLRIRATDGELYAPERVVTFRASVPAVRGEDVRFSPVFRSPAPGASSRGTVPVTVDTVVTAGKMPEGSRPGLQVRSAGGPWTPVTASPHDPPLGPGYRFSFSLDLRSTPPGTVLLEVRGTVDGSPRPSAAGTEITLAGPFTATVASPRPKAVITIQSPTGGRSLTLPVTLVVTTPISVTRVEFQIDTDPWRVASPVSAGRWSVPLGATDSRPGTTMTVALRSYEGSTPGPAASTTFIVQAPPGPSPVPTNRRGQTVSGLEGFDPLVVLVGVAGTASIVGTFRALRRAIVERRELERRILSDLPRSARRRPVAATSWESLKVARAQGDFEPEDVRVRGKPLR